MPTNEEFKELRQRSLASNLRRLFSTDAIVRNIGGKKLKVIDTDELAYATDRNTLRDRFNRIRTSSYNQYSRDFTLSYQAARIELFRDYDCVGPDTIIPLPDGTRPTIAELTEKYKDKPQERFYVFSYDHETDSIKLGKAYHPRKKKGKRQGYKVTFDNGQYVIASLKHPFMMRDGTYKRTFELRVGDSVMPFYQKEYGYNKHGFKRYRKLYNFSKGWQSEHKIVAEQFYRLLQKNEVVHHLDINGANNTPDNLLIMDWKDHKKYHSEYNKNVLWGDKNYETQLNKLKSHPNYVNRDFHHWDGERSGENNTFYGKTHSEQSNQKRSKTLKEVFLDRNQSGEKNPKYRHDITFENVKEKAIEYYKEYSKINLWDFIEHIHCDHSTLKNRLNKEGHDWNSFKNEIESTLNHKIVSIEQIGEIDVYDVTVEKYENFATDSCFVSNTMDMDPIISSALDIYADECLTQNELGDMLTIRSTNDNIKQILHNLFYDILNIEFNLWSWTRNLVKYGDFYLKMYVSPEYGVYMVEPISSYNVTRIENSDLNNKNYVKFHVNLPEGGKIEELENYQIAHFRLLSDSNFLPYGKGIIEGARRVWKQVSLMEDAMLIHRIMRAPEKRVYKVDIGNIPPNEVDQFMEKLINKTKKIPYIDERTGDYNLRFNLWNMVEDIYIPVRGSDSGTSIEPLSGMEFTGIDDIEYLRNKMMAALKIPKAFLGYEEDLSGKATLAAEDVRFARTIQRVQKFIVSELTKIAIVHLYSQGYKDAELVDFSLELTNPSTIFEKEKVSVWQEKVNVAKDMMESKIYSKKWIHTNVFNTNDDDMEVISNDIIEDAKQAFRIKKIEEEGIDPAKPFNKIGNDEESDNDEASDSPFDDAESGGGGGGLDSMNDEPTVPGPEAGPEGPAAAGETSPAQKAQPQATQQSKAQPQANTQLKERDQTGRKKASDYPFGEDVLGDGENRRKSNKTTKKHPISHAYKKNTPLSFEGLEKFLNKTDKKTILSEEKKSYMDENCIIE